MGLCKGEGGQAGEGSSPGPATLAFPQQSEVQSNPLTPFSHSELLSADHHSPWGGSKLQAGAGSTMAPDGLGVCPCVFKDRWCPGHRGSQRGQTSGGPAAAEPACRREGGGRGAHKSFQVWGGGWPSYHAPSFASRVHPAPPPHLQPVSPSSPLENLYHSTVDTYGLRL